jgi:hypothetical protein
MFTKFFSNVIPKSVLEYIKNKLDIMNNYIDYIIKPTYFLLIYFTYLSYLILILGLYFINPEYVKNIRWSLEVLVCLFLIIRFNPLRKANMHVYDQKLIFVLSIILLINLGIISYVISFLKKDTPSSIILDKINIDDKSKTNSLSYQSSNNTESKKNWFNFSNDKLSNPNAFSESDIRQNEILPLNNFYTVENTNV